MFHRTLAVLPALVGAWAERGGGLARSVGSWQDALVDEGALFRYDLLPDRLPRTINMSRLGDVLTDAALDPPVAAMVVWNCNPAVTNPNAEAVRRGLARDDLFTVVHEQFLTDTARYADIVLPATTQIEADDVVLAWGHLWMGWNAKAIEPLGETCTNTELFRRLAAAMALDRAGAVRRRRDAAAADAREQGRPRRALRRDGWIRVPYPEDGRAWGAGVFPTASGSHRARQRAAAGASASRRCRRTSRRARARAATRTCWPAYPLQLMTPKHHARFLNSGYSQLPKHGPAEGGPFVELDAHDAAARGLAMGDLARVWNDRASVTVPVKVTGAPAPRRREHPVRLVDGPPPRRPRRQRPDERHAHRLGRRRGVLGHARRGRAGLNRQRDPARSGRTARTGRGCAPLAGGHPSGRLPPWPAS